jgi:diguanylate cyclase (GGDEF)-like protein
MNEVILSYIYFATFFLLSALALYGLRYISIPGARAFSLLCVAMAIHAGGYGFELLSETAEEMMMWIRVEYIGCSFYSLLIMLFIKDYIGEKRLSSKILIFVLALLNIATLVIVNTNPLHGLYYSSISVDRSLGFPLISTNWGIWYVANIFFVYSILILSIVTIISRLVRAHGRSRKKNIWILAGFLVPVISAVVYHSQWGGIKIDIVPLSFLVMSFLILIGLSKYKVSFLSEITHEIIFGFIEEAIIAVDSEGFIIKTNNTASKFFPEIADVRPGDNIKEYGFLTELKLGEEESQFEHNGKYFRSRLIPIEHFNGRLIVFSDVTEYMLIRKQLEFNATTDLLTGLYNRRYFMDHFRKITKPGCIAFIDLDNFKEINDTMGHLTGDSVLSDFGAQLKLNLREMIACKYGGDEFIIVQQGIPLSDFKNKIRIFASEYRKLKKIADCSFSIGIASYVPGDFESSVAATDKLLYDAKSLGKSRLVSSDGEVTEI